VQAIETVLFDFGGTLDSDGVAWKERFHALYRSEGLDLSADAFAPAFYAADDALVGALAPTVGLEETVDTLTTNLEAELARRGTGQRKIDNARGQRVASRFLSEMSFAFARNRPVLETLSQRYRLGVVSNFYGNLKGACESSGLAPLFGAMADSQRVGAEKPDPAIFQAALAELHANPETTVMVGDSLRRDYEGARRSGMRFIWIAPEDVQAHKRDGAGNRSVLASVTELPDLLDILT
jgi:HAD superfamily hydrolase (TIGR01549 family)